METFEKMYSVKEAGERLGFSADTILRRIRNGKLKAMLLPGDGPNEIYRVSESEIVAFKKRNTKK